jgi:hypothetical protein
LFVDPLRSNGTISTKNIADLFSNIGDIIKINTELLSMLTERMIACPVDDDLCLGDIFLYLGPFLKIYSVYIRNYQNAIRLAAELERKNTAFATFLQVNLMYFIYNFILIEFIEIYRMRWSWITGLHSGTGTEDSSL